jgi:hypothetical protein
MELFEDNKGEVRSSKSKDIQYNAKRKKGGINAES